MSEQRLHLADGWRKVRRVVEDVINAAAEDNVPMMAAAISYYLLLTIAPLLVALSLAAASLSRALDPEASAEASSILGVSAGATTVSVIVTAGIVLFGASGVFSQFVLAVTRIWKEPPRRGPMYAFARRHLLAFLLLGVLGLGLVASLIVGAVLSAVLAQAMELATELGIALPPLDSLVSGRLLADFVASFLLFLTAFAMIPSRKIKLRYIAPGAAATAVAYAVGQAALGVYLASSSRVELYGSLGGIVAVLLWAFYTSMIALYGAELTRVLVLDRENR